MMTPTFLTSLVLALGATSAFGARHPSQRRVVATHQQYKRSPTPQPARHEYLLQNSTLTDKIQARGSQGRATYYHPATEGGAQSSCGRWMNDNTMGVALSIPGWNWFADHGVSQQELCYTPITVHGIFGQQQARIMDECPSDGPTGTCFDICDIDLTYGLFGMLAEHALGIFPVSWTFDDPKFKGLDPCNRGGSKQNKNSPSPSPSSSSSSTSTHPPPSTTSSPSPKPTPSENQGQRLAKKPVHKIEHKEPKAESLYSTELQWWDVIDPQWCPGINTPKDTVTVAVGPSKEYPSEKLGESCGKWITIKNGNASHKAQVVEWIPGTTENYLAVGLAYQNIIGQGSSQVQWSYDA